MPRKNKPSQPSYLLPVQLNVTVPYAYREYLQQVAKDKNTSLAELVRLALRAKYPHSLSFPKREDIDVVPDPATVPEPKPADDERPPWYTSKGEDPPNARFDDDPPDRDHLEWT